MKKDLTLTVENLTDEQVLKEFVKRFNCDAAILIYLDDEKEFGFGRWKTTLGKRWINQLFKTIKSTPIELHS